MQDKDCVQFLQWALPHLHMVWPGFRKVRGQVCKRLQRRLTQLDIDTPVKYRRYLESHKDEWIKLDELVRVTISRFYRDKMMFAYLEQDVLPTIAQQAMHRDDHCVNVWSVGCGAGEEPYTVSIIWKLRLQEKFPELHLKIIASDADENMLQRARAACYAYGTIKNLPEEWREHAFRRQGEDYCLDEVYQADIEFIRQDVRQDMPAETFDLVLCRNLVFTYYHDDLQRKLLEQLKTVLRNDGALILGIHEDLPADVSGFKVWSEKLRIYQKANSQ